MFVDVTGCWNGEWQMEGEPETSPSRRCRRGASLYRRRWARSTRRVGAIEHGSIHSEYALSTLGSATYHVNASSEQFALG